eukprot:CFRG1658T1
MGPRRRIDTKNSARAQQSALQALAHARSLHRETQELEIEFTSTLRSFTSTRQYFDESFHQLRQRIVQNYTKILFTAYEYALEKEIEVHLWRVGFYSVIEACRIGLRKRVMRSASAQGTTNANHATNSNSNTNQSDTANVDTNKKSGSLDKLKIFLDTFLYEASGFYLCLLRRMFSELGLKCPEYLNLCGSTPPLSFTEQSSSQSASTHSCTTAPSRSDRSGTYDKPSSGGGTGVGTESTHHPAVNESVHRSLIFLGDLARYHDGLSESRGPIFSSAHSFYCQAFYGSPEDGRVFNQLAILSQSRQRYPLESVYYYFRALCATVPFGNASANLNSFLVRVKPSGPPPTSTQGKSSEKHSSLNTGMPVCVVGDDSVGVGMGVNVTSNTTDGVAAAQLRFRETHVLMTAFVCWHRSLRGLTRNLEESQKLVESVLTPRAFCLLANSDSFKNEPGRVMIPDVEDHVVTRIMLISISAAHTQNTSVAVQACVWTARQIMEAALLVDTHSPDAEDLLVAVIIFFEWLLSLLSAPGRNALTIETMSRLQQSDWSLIARLTNYHVGNDANMRTLGEVFFLVWKNALQTNHSSKSVTGRRDKTRLPALPEDMALQGFSPLGSLYETVRLPASETTCSSMVPRSELRTHRASRLYGFALLASSLPNTVIPIEAVTSNTRQSDSQQAGTKTSDGSGSDTATTPVATNDDSLNNVPSGQRTPRSTQQTKQTSGSSNSQGGGGVGSVDSAIKVFKASRDISGYKKVWHQGAGGGEWRREGDYEFLREKEVKKESLMKAMGKQRLMAVVQNLEQKVANDVGGVAVGGGDARLANGATSLYQYTLFVVPDLHVVLSSRKHLKAIVAMHRFIVVISTSVIAALDSGKVYKSLSSETPYERESGNGSKTLNTDKSANGNGGKHSSQQMSQLCRAASRWIEEMQQTSGEYFRVEARYNTSTNVNHTGDVYNSNGISINDKDESVEGDILEEQCWQGVISCGKDLQDSHDATSEVTGPEGTMYALLLSNKMTTSKAVAAMGLAVSRSGTFVSDCKKLVRMRRKY